jgi:hypothetical protein
MRTDHQGEDTQCTVMETWNRLMNLRGKWGKGEGGKRLTKDLICILEARGTYSCTKGSLGLACRDQAKSVQRASDIPRGVPDCERVQARLRDPNGARICALAL